MSDRIKVADRRRAFTRVRQLLIFSAIILLAGGARTPIQAAEPHPVSIEKRTDTGSASAATEEYGALYGEDPKAAAEALSLLAPDAAACVRNHASLLEAVRSAQGTIDLERLQSAGPEYHSWHAEKVLKSPSRSLAILQWMSQKTWEAPKGEAKERSARLLVADIERYIEDGRLKGLEGAALARNTVVDLEYGVLPGVSLRPVLDLHKKLVVASRNTGHHKNLYRDLIGLGRLLCFMEGRGYAESESEPQGLFEFMQAEFPEYHFEYPMAMFNPPYENNIPLVTWEDYEMLPSLTYDELAEFVETRCDGENFAWPFTCRMSASRLIAEFKSHQDAVLKVLKRPAAIEKLTLPLCDLLTEREKYLDEFPKGGVEFLKPVVESLKEKAGVLDVWGLYTNYAHAADALLDRLNALDAAASLGSTDALKKELVTALLRAAVVNEQYLPGRSYSLMRGSPLERLIGDLPDLNAEVKEHLRTTVQTMLDDPKAFAELDSKDRDDLAKSLELLVSKL